MDCFGLGGVIIREEDTGTVYAKHSEFCTKWEVDCPLHSTDIRGKIGGFDWLNDDSDKATTFLRELEEWLLSLPIVCIACAIHRPGYVERYKDLCRDRLWLMCKTAYSVLIERAAKFAERESRKLEVYFEQSGKREDRRILSYAKELKANGMPFEEATSDSYNPFKAEDFRRVALGAPQRCEKTVPMIQLADLVLFPIAKGRYHPRYRPYAKLVNSGKLIDSCLNDRERHQIGIKYSCFEGQ